MNEILISAIGVLGGAVGFLYRQQLVTFTKIQTKLDACESDRSKLFERLVKLETGK